MSLSNDFAIATIGQVQSLCKSFFTEFKLNSFNYARIYADKSLLAVHSAPGYAKLYLELNCSPIPSIPFDFWQNNSFYFLPKGGDDETYNKLLSQSNQRFNDDDPLFLINRMSAYTEVAVFCSFLEDKFATSRYLNAIKCFSDFMGFFRDEIEQTFQQGVNSRLYLPASTYPNIPELSCISIVQPNYTEFYRKIANKRSLDQYIWNKISQREMQCLYYLCKGYRYKDIANQLFISDRTVEVHITNARKKLNLRTRSQMIKALSKFID